MDGLVTLFGGSGFIGTHAVRALAKRGWRIRVAVRRPHLAAALRPLGAVGQIQIVHGDVTRAASVEAALEGATACVNLVGILQESAGRRFQQLHVEGSRNVAEAAAARGIDRFVQMSAIGASPQSRAVYARTKGDAEEAVRRRLPQAVILRPSVVFGPEDDFFNRFAKMLGMAPVMPLPGGGKTRFQPVFVGDVAQALAKVLETPQAAGETFELGGPGVFTFREIIELVMRETGRTRPLLPAPFSAAGPMALGGDLISFFGIKPMLTSDQLLMLRRDNVCGAGRPGLAELGILPTAVEAVVPSYLWLHRKGGQFAEPAGV